MSDQPQGGGFGSRGRGVLREPFWQAVLLVAGSYILIRYGLAYLPPLVGLPSAPVPHSVLVQYMLTVVAGVLLYVSADERRWAGFKRPIRGLLVDPRQRTARIVLLVLIPLVVAAGAYRQLSQAVAAPTTLRSVHPAPPSQITYRGATLRLEGLENPLRGSGSLEEHLAVGARVYVQNCVPCHGDLLDGKGHFAHAFNPLPAAFTSNGTIAQLTESYVFWRIAKGGPGLPKEGAPWNSAMPAWEDFLSADEVWAVILYLYDQTGWTPRTWEETTDGGEH